jgi:EAL domain-containing protein (putative c-di-GMP-specific phosphodiesterase class I)/GGDEF domain-containing protein
MDDENNKAELELRAVIESISDQLCLTLRDDFDVHVEVDTQHIEGQKLSVLVNFLLENVRRQLSKLEALNEELEGRVEERTNRLNLVIAGAADTVWFYSHDTNTIEISGNKLSGMESWDNDSAITPEKLHEHIHPHDLPNVKETIKRNFKKESTNLNMEFRLKAYDEKYRWYLCRGACQYDKDGVAELVAGTLTDITMLNRTDQSSGLPNEESIKEIAWDHIENGDVVSLIGISFSQLDRILDFEKNLTVKQARKSIANYFIEHWSKAGVIGKLSGDVFLVMVINRRPSFIHQLCIDLRQGLNDFFESAQLNRYKPEVHIASTSNAEIEFKTPEDLIRTALMALKQSKATGAVYHFSESSMRRTSEKLALESALREGLEKKWVIPFFQPIINVFSKRIVGYESLARFTHPNLGTVSPAQFIPLAEEAGLMPELGYQILESSISIIAKLANTYPSEQFYVGVNVSSVQFGQDDFAQTVVTMLETYDVKPQLLHLEVTESAVIENVDCAGEKLKLLRKHGVKIALDDFGTGYSSLSYLRSLPIDIIKIDRSFISGIDKDKGKTPIVKTICGLAKLLNLDVIAEGVETNAELAITRNLGVNEMQGFLFSKPIAPEQLDEFINQFGDGR